jgi:N-methylhydantoinase A
VRSIWPNDHVVASSHIVPEIREYERASTAALNAYLQPVMGRYLERLDRALTADRFAGQILIAQSNGSVMTIERTRQVPILSAQPWFLTRDHAAVDSAGE